MANRIFFNYGFPRFFGSPFLLFKIFFEIKVSTSNRPGFQEMQSLIEAGKVSTIIVKNLSRFGRENLLCGHYTEIVYPTLVVNFIAIQENVDTTKGMGTEMMPFHNIFTELKGLTPTVVNKLIERIEIHNNVKVDIYFTAIGLFDIPTEQQLLQAFEKLQKQTTYKSA